MIQWFSSSSSASDRKELARRGFELGWIAEDSRLEMPDCETIKTK